MMRRSVGSLSIVETCLFSTICVGAMAWHSYQKLTTKAKKLPTEDHRRKVVVISGCDRGLGREMVIEWSSNQPDGDNYFIVALTLTEAAARDLSEDSSNAVGIQCDVTSDKDVAIMKTKVESILQDKQAVLYAIVNNAGIADPGDFVFHSTLDIPKKVMDVNYFGQLRVTQALLPLMLTTSREAGGKIFNMSSVCGASASAGNFSYNASKFAVEAWSDSLRVELAPFGIKSSRSVPDESRRIFKATGTRDTNAIIPKRPSKFKISTEAINLWKASKRQWHRLLLLGTLTIHRN